MWNVSELFGAQECVEQVANQKQGYKPANPVFESHGQLLQPAAEAHVHRKAEEACESQHQVKKIGHHTAQ